MTWLAHILDVQWFFICLVKSLHVSEGKAIQKDNRLEQRQLCNCISMNSLRPGLDHQQDGPP